MGTRILDNVERVHFYEGDKNSPEDICLPSCLTSLAGSLGVDVGREVREGWNRRTLYYALLAWTGMGWGLLWHSSGCSSCMDLTQIDENGDEALRLGFEGIGCRGEVLENTPGNAGEIRRRIVDSIDRGIPVLGFRLVDPPEPGLVCGYGDGGGVLFGWDMFQKFSPCEQRDDGMFLLRDWSKAWKFAFVTERGPAPDLNSPEMLGRCLRRGVEVMEKNAAPGYLAGEAAYAAWREYTLAEGIPAKEAEARHFLVHHLIGNHAEARCYTGEYLMNPAFPEEVREVGKRFRQVHDLCWKAWGVLGKYGEPQNLPAGKFTVPENRVKMAAVIDEMAQTDREALRILKAYLEKQSRAGDRAGDRAR